MKYVFFVSREPWASFNSIYAYVKSTGEYPSNFVAFYSSDENMSRVERMLRILYSVANRNFEIKKVRISDFGVEDLATVLEGEIEEGDIVDITDARKLSILSLMRIKGVKVVYLQLQDMRFSERPFLMRPLSVQRMEVVSI